MYDIVIIGCGPAGLSAAIYALRAGAKVLLLEKETIGGKIASSPVVENYPGFQKISGEEFSQNLYEQVISLGGIVEIEEVVEIIPGKIKIIRTDEKEWQAKAVIVATGSSYRKLGLSKEEELIGNGISFCSVCDGAFYKDKIVAVIGGGNSAMTSAISLSSICKYVHLLVRGESLKGDSLLIKDIKCISNIEVHYHTTINKLIGQAELESIIIDDGEEREIKVDGVFVSIGQIPETKFIENMITLNDSHYIVSGEDCKTNIEGIFVAGDCRDKTYRQLTTAVNDGTISALNAILYLKNENFEEE